MFTQNFSSNCGNYFCLSVSRYQHTYLLHKCIHTIKRVNKNNQHSRLLSCSIHVSNNRNIRSRCTADISKQTSRICVCVDVASLPANICHFLAEAVISRLSVSFQRFSLLACLLYTTLSVALVGGRRVFIRSAVEF